MRFNLPRMWALVLLALCCATRAHAADPQPYKVDLASHRRQLRGCDPARNLRSHRAAHLGARQSVRTDCAGSQRHRPIENRAGELWLLSIERHGANQRHGPERPRTRRGADGAAEEQGRAGGGRLRAWAALSSAPHRHRRRTAAIGAGHPIARTGCAGRGGQRAGCGRAPAFRAPGSGIRVCEGGPAGRLRRSSGAGARRHLPCRGGSESAYRRHSSRGSAAHARKADTPQAHAAHRRAVQFERDRACAPGSVGPQRVRLDQRARGYGCRRHRRRTDHVSISRASAPPRHHQRRLLERSRRQRRSDVERPQCLRQRGTAQSQRESDQRRRQRHDRAWL